MSEKIYVGKGKPIGKFGNLKIGIRVSDLVPNEKGYVNLITQEMKKPDEYGNTHTVYVDDWVPNGQQKQQREPLTTRNNQPAGQVDESDLPF